MNNCLNLIYIFKIQRSDFIEINVLDSPKRHRNNKVTEGYDFRAENPKLV